MTRSVGKAVCLAGVVLALAAGPAREEAPPIPTEHEESVRVVLVQVPLIATDRHGRPVTDLKPDEVTVQTDGEKFPARFLDPVHRPASATDEPPVRLYVDAPGGWQLPQTSTAGEPEYVLFFVDVQNDNRLQRQRATDEAVEFAKTGLGPAVRASVASFDGTVHVELPFTTDRAALSGALMQAWGRTGAARLDLQAEMRDLLRQLDECVLPGQQSLKREADETCVRQLGDEYVAQVRSRAEEFLDALKDVVGFLAGLRGRKTVYVMTHGVPMDPGRVVAEALRSVIGITGQIASVQLYLGRDNSVEIARDRLQELAVRNKVALNFVDRMTAPTQDRGASSGRLMYGGIFPSKFLYTSAQDDLQEIAAGTGGMFTASPDVGQGLAQLWDAQDGAYDLGFELDRMLSDSDMSKIKVKTSRRGVRLTYRRGYYVKRAAADAASLHGRIVVHRSGGTPAAGALGIRHEFEIEADPKQIGYVDSGREMTATFTLQVLVEDSRGRERIGTYNLINHSYPRDLWNAGKVAFVTIRGTVELPPGTFTLRAVFRNIASGWTGELQQTVSVPKEPAS